MRFAVFLSTALLALAADPAVRREGPSFRISGANSESDIALYVGLGDVPPVLGSFSRDGADFLFRPRFDLPKTVDSRIVVAGKTFHFPAESQPAQPSTFVQRIFPSTSQIPANQLKFYVEFSAPMLPGQAWDHLRLLDAAGKPVELAFLEIDQELWDRDAKRLTLLFDPGRIKRGVLPRDQIGAALEPGKTYTLEIDARWRDANRAPLLRPFRKTFTVVDEDRSPIVPANWKLTLPKANTRQPLIIHFGEPLDAPLALRLISINVPGQATLGPNETELHFLPDSPWPATPLQISIDSALEDLAGNKVGRPFDVDTFDRITVRSSPMIVRLPFQPR